MFRGGISLSQDQARIEMAREQAIIKEGKSFITLLLLENTMNRIQGAMVLHAQPFLDSITNMNKFHFEERGGPLIFTLDEFKGGMYCRMLDCEHNRKFLASMFYANYWKIEDSDIEKEIKIAAEAITARFLAASGGQAVQAPPKEALMTDDELEAESARLQAEAAKRRIAKVESLNRPVRQIVEAAKEHAENVAGINEQTTAPVDTDPIPVDTVTEKPRKKRKESLVTAE